MKRSSNAAQSPAHERHRTDRQNLYNAKEDRIAAMRAGNRALARPEWKALYAQQKRELANLRRLQKRANEKIQQTFRDTEQTWPGDRAVSSLYRARNPQPVPGPLRAPKGRRASKQEKSQARGAEGKPGGIVRVSDWLRAEKADRSGYLREAFQLSGLWAIELAERHKNERAAFSAHLKRINNRDRDEIKEQYSKDLMAMKTRHKEEAADLENGHLEERKTADLEKETGRDREIFRTERREHLRSELERNKLDIHRPFSLADQFNQARAKSREQEFREQAKDTTTPPPHNNRKISSLAAEFRKAREQAAPEHKIEIFKENAEDIEKDIGRERSRKRKPPPYKPD